MPNTVRLHRVLTTKPDKVYRAFIEADALAKWLPPNGFTCTVHQLDGKLGGTFKMSFRNFTTGMSHSFGGEYLELIPGERLRYTDRFDDPNLPGEIQVTVTLKRVSVGTDVNIVQEGIPDAIPVEMCYLGWQGFVAKSRQPRRARNQSIDARLPTGFPFRHDRRQRIPVITVRHCSAANGQRVTTINSVCWPVSVPRPRSEMMSDEPGTNTSPIRSRASGGN